MGSWAHVMNGSTRNLTEAHIFDKQLDLLGSLNVGFLSLHPTRNVSGPIILKGWKIVKLSNRRASIGYPCEWQIIRYKLDEMSRQSNGITRQSTFSDHTEELTDSI